jgi:adenine deaminase
VEFTKEGLLIDLIQRKIEPARVTIAAGKIAAIDQIEKAPGMPFLLPGFVDSHVHIESSMLIPSEFARLATVHGTVGTVSDPHEIANVLGIEGVRYMIRNGRQVPFYFYFGAPSCVPATTFETSGATITAAEIESLFADDHLKYLCEMMNFPGVLQHDNDVYGKLEIAKKWQRPIDGHAPGLRGEQAAAYAAAGISSDHECFTYPEGLDKARLGMKILIREGSAAKNYEALHPLIREFPTQVMFCSDDKHPHDLVDGHINTIVKMSIDKGYDLFDVLHCATVNPIRHYDLDIGLLEIGDNADFIVIDDLCSWQILETYIQGICVARRGSPLIQSVAATTPNNFAVKAKKASDFAVAAAAGNTIQVIVPEDGQLITASQEVTAPIANGYYTAAPERNLLKLTVVNRYSDAPPAVAFIANFGLTYGALASSIAHDSHNIIAVGCSDQEIAEAVNALIATRGGIAVYDGLKADTLPLPVAGIMSNRDGYTIAEQYRAIDGHAKRLGSKLSAPFMTLSFMALLVIPSLKLSDRGLFDSTAFAFSSLSK